MAFTLFDFALVRVFIAGFALAAPVGPVSVLCTRRALSVGRLRAFIAGLGAAVADMIFGAVAGLGIGGIIVLTVGIGTLRTAVAKADGNAAPSFISRDLAATFSMAITNPATMIAAAGLFATFAPVDMYTEPMTAAMLVAGVFIGG
jgi:threonine/homoserine/homoserine lactone efflux protein